MSLTTPTRRHRKKSEQPAASESESAATADWTAWQKHLRKRDARGWKTLEPKLKGAPLSWGIASLPADAATLPLVNLLTRFPELPQTSSTVIAELTLWRATLADSAASWPRGLVALAWASALPALAEHLSPESWHGLLDDLNKLAGDAAALAPAEDPLAHQLLAVELPLTLAYQFPELSQCCALTFTAKKLWAWGAEEATDGEGLLFAWHLAQMKGLLACWTRCIALSSAIPEAGLDEDVQAQYQWLLRQSLRLLRDDGSLLFSATGEHDDAKPLFKAALAITDDPADHALAKAVLHGVKKPGKKKKHADPFVHSEWSKAALLRGNWDAGAPRLAISYGDPEVKCELSAFAQTLLAGDWHTEVTIDGWNWQPQHAWEEVCWHTDEEVVYLEIETKLTDGWQLQRQIMLAGKDQVLFIADAILGEVPANIAYRSVLPFAPGMRLMPADETRDGYLANKRTRALAMPLALPEWRIEGGRGELAEVPGGLELTQTAQGRRMFAPLWIDLNSDRMRKPCTWRQLTVGEQLQILPRDVAVAYRVQVGKEQFVVYRSLEKKSNRTFMGQNVVNEFFVGRFTKDGTTETLVEVE